MFYRSHCCNDKVKLSTDENTPGNISKSIINQLLNSVFNSSNINKRPLFKATFNILSKGILNGYGQSLETVKYNSPDFVMLNQLEYNMGVFSAFKNHSQINEMVALLKDENGKLRSFKDFKTEALKIDNTYNKRWLRVEYNHAISSARAARKWQDIQRTKHIYPNLQYKSITDDRTRELHKNWNGIILPVDHPFWNTHFPPNDWECRCTSKRTDKKIDTKGLEVDNMPKLPSSFNHNTGKTGKVFTEDHPYFDTKDKAKVNAYAKREIVRVGRERVKAYAKLKKITKKKYKSQIGKIKISGKSFKELLGKYNDDTFMKNNLLYNINDVIKDALYVKSAADTKGNSMINKYHYLLVKVADKNFYLNVREMVDGEMVLYAITSKIQ